MQNLTINLDKLHTTDFGAVRIKRNLNLLVDDVVLWCQESVKQADVIIGQGKNWYVYRALVTDRQSGDALPWLSRRIRGI